MCLRWRSGRVLSRRPRRACSRPSSNFETRALSSAATLAPRRQHPLPWRRRRPNIHRGGTRNARPSRRGIHDPLPIRRSESSVGEVSKPRGSRWLHHQAPGVPPGELVYQTAAAAIAAVPACYDANLSGYARRMAAHLDGRSQVARRPSTDDRWSSLFGGPYATVRFGCGVLMARTQLTRREFDATNVGEYKYGFRLIQPRMAGR
jgi:hypothetical protein